MILIPDVKNKKIGVFGLGVSGLATCEALIASGAQVFSFDENATAREKTANTEYRCEHPKEWPWKELTALVVSPGVPLASPKPHAIVRKAHQEKVPVFGDTELFARAINAMPEKGRPRVVGVTGTNGKSTTTALLGHILKESGVDVYVGGNIGEAVLSLPEPHSESVYVLELSSYQLDLTHSLRLDAAVFLNLAPDHLDRHGSMENYLAAKMRIFMNQQPGDLAVVGVDDDYGEAVCTELTARHVAEVAPVSAQGTLGRGFYVLDGKLFYNLDGKTTEAGELAGARALAGSHNHQNIAAAVAVASRFGAPPTVAVKAAERFEGLRHRLEEVGRLGKVIFINDSKATNIAAAARALSAYSDVYWIAGGRAKEDTVAELSGAMGQVRKAYFIGEAASVFEEDLGGIVKSVICDELTSALAQAAADAHASDAKTSVVLLSPACASHDQFKNFEARGDAFRAAVAELEPPAVENGAAA